MTISEMKAELDTIDMAIETKYKEIHNDRKELTAMYEARTLARNRLYEARTIEYESGFNAKEQ